MLDLVCVVIIDLPYLTNLFVHLFYGWREDAKYAFSQLLLPTASFQHQLSHDYPISNGLTFGCGLTHPIQILEVVRVVSIDRGSLVPGLPCCMRECNLEQNELVRVR